MIGKCPDMTEAMLKNIAEGEIPLERSPGNTCLISQSASLPKEKPIGEI